MGVLWCAAWWKSSLASLDSPLRVRTIKPLDWPFSHCAKVNSTTSLPKRRRFNRHEALMPMWWTPSMLPSMEKSRWTLGPPPPANIPLVFSLKTFTLIRSTYPRRVWNQNQPAPCQISCKLYYWTCQPLWPGSHRHPIWLSKQVTNRKITSNSGSNNN